VIRFFAAVEHPHLTRSHHFSALKNAGRIEATARQLLRPRSSDHLM